MTECSREDVNVRAQQLAQQQQQQQMERLISGTTATIAALSGIEAALEQEISALAEVMPQYLQAQCDKCAHALAALAEAEEHRSAWEAERSEMQRQRAGMEAERREMVSELARQHMQLLDAREHTDPQQSLRPLPQPMAGGDRMAPSRSGGAIEISSTGDAAWMRGLGDEVVPKVTRPACSYLFLRARAHTLCVTQSFTLSLSLTHTHTHTRRWWTLTRPG